MAFGEVLILNIDIGYKIRHDEFQRLLFEEIENLVSSISFKKITETLHCAQSADRSQYCSITGCLRSALVDCKTLSENLLFIAVAQRLHIWYRFHFFDQYTKPWLNEHLEFIAPRLI